MKYYYNEQKELLLIDENEFTPYLKDRGYTEVTKEEYDAKNEELKEIYRQEHPEEFEIND